MKGLQDAERRKQSVNAYEKNDEMCECKSQVGKNGEERQRRREEREKKEGVIEGER